MTNKQRERLTTDKTKIFVRENITLMSVTKDELRRHYNEIFDRLQEYEVAEETGQIIALPKLQFRQIVYFIYNGKIHPLEVTSYAVRPEFGNMLQIHLYRNGFNGCCTIDDFGKTVFLSKEEAEEALKGGVADA